MFDNDEAACVIRDVKVSVVPFLQVSAEHAYKEGEDDRSLEKWREVHRRVFTPDYRPATAAATWKHLATRTCPTPLNPALSSAPAATRKRFCWSRTYSRKRGHRSGKK